LHSPNFVQLRTLRVTGTGDPRRFECRHDTEWRAFGYVRGNLDGAIKFIPRFRQFLNQAETAGFGAGDFVMGEEISHCIAPADFLEETHSAAACNARIKIAI
jgi:hypothetical protein